MTNLDETNPFNIAALNGVLRSGNEMNLLLFQAQLAAADERCAMREEGDGSENVAYSDLPGDILQQLAIASSNNNNYYIQECNNINSSNKSITTGGLIGEIDGNRGNIKEGPKLGEGGNWKCDQCNNVNYPRRKNCNRCKAPRSKENDILVAEFNRVKDELQSMGFDATTASTAAAAQQVACKFTSNYLSQLSLFSNLSNAQNNTHNVYAATPKSTRTTTATTSANAQSPYSLPMFFSNGINNVINGAASHSFSSPTLTLQNCSSSPFLDAAYGGGVPQGLLELPFSLGIASRTGDGSINAYNNAISPFISPSCLVNGVSPVFTASPSGGITADSGSFDGLLPPPFSPLQLILLKAKEVADKILLDFENLGDTNPTSKSVEVLKTALAMLGHTVCENSPNNNVITCSTTINNSNNNVENLLHGVGGPHFSAPAMLAHPDEFKNPSSFLKIYGDPLCEFGMNSGYNLLRGQNGNWCCSKCKNVNFPRRFRCNKCSQLRDDDGDRTVAEYAKNVYHQHLKVYKNCKNSNSSSSSNNNFEQLCVGGLDECNDDLNSNHKTGGGGGAVINYGMEGIGGNVRQNYLSTLNGNTSNATVGTFCGKKGGKNIGNRMVKNGGTNRM